MAAVYHFSVEDEELHSAFAEIQTRLNAVQQEEKIQLNIANSLWPQDKYPFLKDYLELAKDLYNTEITPVDYKKDTETAGLRINSWVEGKTKNRIENIIPETQPPFLPRITRMVFVNTIYFKGEWNTKFDNSATTNLPFYLNKTDTIDAPIMTQTGEFNYSEDDILQILEIPYTGNELSMMVFLPRENDGLQSLEENITADVLVDRTSNLSMELAEVYLPKFKTTFQFDLKNVLETMGMHDTFDINKADFSGMDGNTNWLYIGFAVHKAYVDVNEEGTEAEAVTAGGCFPSGTEVLTASGPRAIETVDAGTKVYACDLAAEEWAIKKVIKQQSFQYEGDMITIQISHIKIKATGNHPFYVLKGDRLASRPVPREIPKEEQRMTGYGRWVEARYLKKGDMLKDKNGEGLVITTLSSRQVKTKVYTLDVDCYSNFAVHKKGILVHNGKEAGPPTKAVIFRADHPFLFLICDNLTESILFVGRVQNPIIE